MTNKINIIGDILGTSGYSRHTRSIANALNGLCCDVRLDIPRQDQWERYVTDAELNMITKDFNPDCVSIIISQPQSWRLALSEKPKHAFGFCVWEGDCVPNYFIEYLLDKRIDKILVPSENTKQAILNTMNKKEVKKTIGYDEIEKIYSKIVIIPHGVDFSKFKNLNIPVPDNEPLAFLINKGWRGGENDRGGVQFAINAYLEEFTNKDNVCMKVHINPAYLPAGFDIEKELEKIGITKKEDRPSLKFTFDNLDDSALCRFYNDGDVFVSTSMADSFDIPCLEAMACGRPCIVTDNNGHCDFVNETNGWVINGGEWGYFSNDIAYEDIKWFKPDIKSIKDKMRYVYEHQSEIQTKSELSIETASKFTWLNTAKKIKEIINNL